MIYRSSPSTECDCSARCGWMFFVFLLASPFLKSLKQISILYLNSNVRGRIFGAWSPFVHRLSSEKQRKIRSAGLVPWFVGYRGHDSRPPRVFRWRDGCGWSRSNWCRQPCSGWHLDLLFLRFRPAGLPFYSHMLVNSKLVEGSKSAEFQLSPPG